MTANEAHEKGLISKARKNWIMNTSFGSLILVIVVTMFACLYFGIGAAANAKVEATHSKFHAVTGVVNSKSSLLGGQKDANGEFLDHYRLRVRFTDSTGRVRNPEAAFSWKLKNSPTVKVYDGPGTTYDIPGAIEGPHPRTPTLWWMWLAGVIASLVVGIILGVVALLAVESLLMRPYSEKTENGPIPAT